MTTDTKDKIIDYISSHGQARVHDLQESLRISRVAIQRIEANFLHITPDGKLLYGMKGFIYWATDYQKDKPLTVLVNEYVKIIHIQEKQFSPQGWFDATPKL